MIETGKFSGRVFGLSDELALHSRSAISNLFLQLDHRIESAPSSVLKVHGVNLNFDLFRLIMQEILEHGLNFVVHLGTIFKHHVEETGFSTIDGKLRHVELEAGHLVIQIGTPVD